MEEKHPVDLVLLKRFFNDQCTEEEKQEVYNWLSDPENQHFTQLIMEQRWRDVQGMHEPGTDFEKLMERTRVKLSGTASSLYEPDDNVRETDKQRRFSWRLAAVWLGILVTFSASLFFFLSRNAEPPSMASTQETIDKAVVQEVTDPGQISVNTLPDGTKVWLNAQSSLTFPQSFAGQPAREVVLNGEAFFEVTENRDQPFIVRTHSINIVVVGTAFNLKAYQGDPTIETTLVRGKVLIEKNNGQAHKPVELKPNQKAIFSQATERITLMDMEVKELTRWNNGSLEFEDDALYDVIKSLERWYGITIHLQEESNLSCRLTARIDKESLEQTLEVLKSLTGIRYSIVNKDVFIEGKICKQ